MPTLPQVIETLKTCIDPEIHVDVWTLELIYGVELAKDGAINVKLTFTTPSCPYGPLLLQDIHDKLKALPDVKEVKIDLVFEPAWQPSEELKTMMGMTSNPTTPR